jgi:hypothetical protein
VTESNHEIFVRTCCSAFRRLVDHYGFAEPVIEPLGRETFIRYLKGYREVSIAYEPGAAPIVEFFYPSSETGERPTWWAEEDGVQRTRRFPTYRIEERYKESDPASCARYLEATAAALEREERAFLSEPIHDQPR